LQILVFLTVRKYSEAVRWEQEGHTSKVVIDSDAFMAPNGFVIPSFSSILAKVVPYQEGQRRY
jgi:hypothetical protein